MVAKRHALVCLWAIPLLLAACLAPAPTGTPASTPTDTPHVVIVGGEPATYTVVPTYTPPPTYTPMPTYTAVATFTPLPTFTPLIPGLPTQTPTRRITRTPLSPAELSDLEGEMFAAINAERDKEGLDPLVLDAALTELARGHAQDMVERDYRGHVNPDGQTYKDRLVESGIEVDWQGENWYGDNCAPHEIVSCTMEWLMDDAPSRANIVHKRYTRVGIGIVQAGLDGYVIVQDFTED